MSSNRLSARQKHSRNKEAIKRYALSPKRLDEQPRMDLPKGIIKPVAPIKCFNTLTPAGVVDKEVSNG